LKELVGGPEAGKRGFSRMTASYEKLVEQWGRSQNNTPELLTELIEQKLGFKLTEKEATALFASFTNGDVIEWSHQLNNPNGILGQIAGNHTGVGWTGTSHTSDPTMVTAIGPQSERFSGIVPNQEVHRHFLELLG
jgi:alkaline phosphatase